MAGLASESSRRSGEDLLAFLMITLRFTTHLFSASLGSCSFHFEVYSIYFLDRLIISCRAISMPFDSHIFAILPLPRSSPSLRFDESRFML